MEAETLQPKAKKRRGPGRPATGRTTTLVRVPDELLPALEELKKLVHQQRAAKRD